MFKWARDFSSRESRNLTRMLKLEILQGHIFAYSNILPLSREYVNFCSFFSFRVKICPECHEGGLHEKRVALGFNNIFQCVCLSEENWIYKWSKYTINSYYFMSVFAEVILEKTAKMLRLVMGIFVCFRSFLVLCFS